MRVKSLDYIEQKEDVINRCDVCNIAMVDEEGTPYVLPFNFAYKDQVLYLHSAPEGKKMDILKKNNRICVSFSTDHELYHQNENVACSYSMRYKSVLLHGKVEFIDELEKKREILNLIMKKYSSRDDFKYSLPALKNVRVMKVAAKKIEGKTFGY